MKQNKNIYFIVLYLGYFSTPVQASIQSLNMQAQLHNTHQRSIKPTVHIDTKLSSPVTITFTADTASFSYTYIAEQTDEAQPCQGFARDGQNHDITFTYKTFLFGIDGIIQQFNVEDIQKLGGPLTYKVNSNIKSITLSKAPSTDTNNNNTQNNNTQVQSNSQVTTSNAQQASDSVTGTNPTKKVHLCTYQSES